MDRSAGSSEASITGRSEMTWRSESSNDPLRYVRIDRPAREHAVQGDAEGPDVGGPRGSVAADRLGGQVLDRSDRSVSGEGLAGVDHLGEAEVAELARRPVEEDVRGLDVAVRHPDLVQGVGGSSGVGDRQADLVAVEGAGGVGQRAVGQVLGRVVQIAVLVAPRRTRSPGRGSRPRRRCAARWPSAGSRHRWRAGRGSSPRRARPTDPVGAGRPPARTGRGSPRPTGVGRCNRRCPSWW